VAKDREISNFSQSLVVLGFASFHGVLAETPRRPVSSLQGGRRRFESFFAHQAVGAGRVATGDVLVALLVEYMLMFYSDLQQ